MQLPPEVFNQITSNERLYNIILQNYPSLLLLKSSSDPKMAAETKQKEKKLKKREKKDFDKKLEIVREKLLQPIPENHTAVITPKQARQDWFSRQIYTDNHYLKGIRVHRNSIMHRGAMMNIAKYKLRASSCPDIYKNSMWSVEDPVEEVIGIV